MQPEEEFDRYFMDQILGGPMSVDMGPTKRRRVQPSRGALINSINGQASLVGLAVSGLMAQAPQETLIGKPVSFARLVRMRRDVVALVLLVWSVLLWQIFRLIQA